MPGVATVLLAAADEFDALDTELVADLESHPGAWATH